MSITKVFIQEWNVHDSVEDARYDLIMNDIPIGKEIDDYVGHGGYGDVYSLRGIDKVLKIHDEQDDFDIVNKIMSSGKDFKNVVKYFFNKRMEPYYITVMERLEQIPRQDLNYYNDAHRLSLNIVAMMSKKGMVSDRELKEVLPTLEDIDHLVTGIERLYDEEMFKLIIFQIDWLAGFRKDKVVEVAKFFITRKQFVTDVYNGMEELKSIGIVNDDLHLGNVMVDPKTDTYKIIDPMAGRS